MNKVNKLKKLLLVGIAVVSVSTGLVAYAARVDVDGGTWVYGKNPLNSFSEYYHGYNYHGAKVVNRNNGTTNIANNKPGVWAKASIWDIWDGSSYYYKSNGYY